jgi:hypothetical protein
LPLDVVAPRAVAEAKADTREFPESSPLENSCVMVEFTLEFAVSKKGIINCPFDPTAICCWISRLVSSATPSLTSSFATSAGAEREAGLLKTGLVNESS